MPGEPQKLAPGELAHILGKIPKSTDPNLLVGTETSDDAGIYRISDELALVNTVDYFTPIVDDPYTFGAIAATNSLSDVYSMGGVPKTALNITCWPQSRLGSIHPRQTLSKAALKRRLRRVLHLSVDIP